jgi:hypothetical protein
MPWHHHHHIQHQPRRPPDVNQAADDGGGSDAGGSSRFTDLPGSTVEEEDEDLGTDVAAWLRMGLMGARAATPLQCWNHAWQLVAQGAPLSEAAEASCGAIVTDIAPPQRRDRGSPTDGATSSAFSVTRRLRSSALPLPLTSTTIVDGASASRRETWAVEEDCGTASLLRATGVKHRLGAHTGATKSFAVTERFAASLFSHVV